MGVISRNSRACVHKLCSLCVRSHEFNSRGITTQATPGTLHGQRLGGLWPLTFLFNVLWNGKGAAIKRTQAQPGHIEDRPKALLNVRTSVPPYQGLDVADQEKQDGEPPMST